MDKFFNWAVTTLQDPHSHLYIIAIIDIAICGLLLRIFKITNGKVTKGNMDFLLVVALVILDIGIIDRPSMTIKSKLIGLAICNVIPVLNYFGFYRRVWFKDNDNF